jgi:outer membrane lipoprotein SlyB
MSSNKVLAICMLSGSVALTGCALPGQGGGDYSRGQVRGEQSVRFGVIESVRDVRINAPHESGVGTLAGAALGGIAGSEMGRGRGSTAGAIAGAVIGGIAGQAIEKNANDRRGVEVVVRLDSGKIIAITQEADEAFRAGDRVRILSGQGVTRVTRM